MSNTITAYFKGRVGVAESVYQNDYGIVMAFDSIDLPAHFDCYFSRLNQEEALPGLGADNRVTIPNSILANPGNVTIHIPLHTGEDDSEVEYVIYFKVIGRARPIDDGTPTQMTAIERALALLSQPITNIEEIVNEALSFTGDTFAEMKQELADDFAEYKGDVDDDIADFKTEIRGDIADVEHDFDILDGQFQTAVAAITVDSEVQGIRTGDDGVTYTSAGEAVRKQFAAVKSKLYRCVPTLSFPNTGYVKNDGTIDSSADSFATTDLIEVYDKIILDGKLNGLNSSFQYVHCYDKNEAHLGGLVTGTGSTITLNNQLETLIAGTKYIRITAYASNVSKIALIIPATTLLDKSELIHSIDSVSANVDDLQSIVGEYSDVSLTWVAGYIATSGKLESADSFRRTELIAIPDGAIGYKVNGYTLNNALCAICFYGDNTAPVQNNYVDAFVTSTDVGTYYDSIPIGAKYYACSKSASNSAFELQFAVASDTFEESYINAVKSSQYEKLFGWLGFTAFSKFASVGDSLSVGYHTEFDGTAVDKDLDHSWGAYVEKQTGCKSYWTGISGATTRGWLNNSGVGASWGLGYCRALGEMPLYVICMGANEGGIDIGTIDDVDDETPSTLYGYVGKVISELRSISPKCFIVCTGVARRQNSAAINAVYKNVCEIKSKCYYLDCQEEFNSPLLKPYYNDSHYGANGYAVMAKLFDYKFGEVMRDNISDFIYINEADETA